MEKRESVGDSLFSVIVFVLFIALVFRGCSVDDVDDQDNSPKEKTHRSYSNKTKKHEEPKQLSAEEKWHELTGEEFEN